MVSAPNNYYVGITEFLSKAEELLKLRAKPSQGFMIKCEKYEIEYQSKKEKIFN